MDTKICQKCGEEKPLEAYYQKKYGYGAGLCYWGTCKTCANDRQRQYSAQYYATHRVSAIQATRVWQKANPKKVRLAAAKCIAARKQRDVYFDWAVYVRNGHSKKYTMHISTKELADIARTVTECPICGVAINWQKDRKYSGVSPSLDRTNNEQTITKNNIQIICASCNRTKSNRTMLEFIEYCKTVVGRFPDGV